MKKLILACLITLMLTPYSFAKEVAGVNLNESMKLDSQSLVLNGAGIREKFFVNVYACGLYTSAKTTNAAQIINDDKPMAIQLVITTGLVSKEKMQKAMIEGFENSTNGKMAALQSKIDQFNKCFSDEIVKKDNFIISYIPKTGVQVKKNGVLKGTIQGLDFKKAVFGIWLGDKPADDDLKDDLLDN